MVMRLLSALCLVLVIGCIVPVLGYYGGNGRCSNNWGSQNYCCPSQQLPLPNYALTETVVDPAIVPRLNELFPEGRHPRGSFLADNVGITCLAELGCSVNITWLLEGAGYQNVFGYYFFDKISRQIIVKEEDFADYFALSPAQQDSSPIEPGLYPAFPDTSALNSKGCLEAGDRVTLANNIAYGETMAFFLRANGANRTPTGKKSAPTWYSSTGYFTEGGLENDDGWDVEDPTIPTKHFGWVSYEDEIIFGCEDLNLGAGTADRDYNDVMFLINIDGDWDDTFIPFYNCDEADECDVYECPQISETYIGVEFTAEAHVTLDGGIQIADFKYSWTNGGWELDTNGELLETHTYDTYCTIDHDGEYLYTQGSCGCEETFIAANQPQLFVESGVVDPADEYYVEASPHIINNFEGRGYAVKHYVRQHSHEFVTDLYLRNDNDHIVRAIYEDGRILDFYNVIYGDAQAPIEIVRPEIDCKCRRNLNVILVAEKSPDVIGAAYGHVRTFLQNFVSDLVIGSDHSSVGLIEYDHSHARVTLRVTAGNVQGNVDAVLAEGAFACSLGLTNPCATPSSGFSGPHDGDVVAAINEAVADHNRLNSAGAKLIIVVTNGWSNSDASVHTAVQQAADAGITVLAVTYGVNKPLYTLNEITYVNGSYEPDNIVYRSQSASLSSVDPIDVSSRTCLIAEAPCGGCCGVCDTTCSGSSDQCISVSECPEGTCTTVNIINQNDFCCTTVSRERDYCEVVIVDGQVVSGNPGLSGCQQGTCSLDATGSPSCSYEETCVSTACENAECSYLGNNIFRCETSPIEAPNACVTVECVNNELVSSPVECAAPTGCKTVRCDDEDGCVYTPKPDPYNPLDACTTYSCVNNEYVEDPPLCQTQSLCVIGTCSTEDGTAVCTNTDKCSTDDLCETATCNPQDGECTIEPIACLSETRPCMENIGCLGGQCSFVPRTCVSDVHPCLAMKCVTEGGVDMCVRDEENDTCDQCPEACTNNACVKVPCEFQQCNVTNQVETECTSDDTCLIASCDDVQGCVTSPVSCAGLVPSDSCHVFVKNSTHPGCCQEVPKDCGGPDLCSIYTCDVSTPDGCVVDPVICTPPICRDNNPSFEATFGCNPDTGLCPSIPRSCDQTGCEVYDCNVATNECEVVSAENCACECAPNNVCQTTNCDSLIDRTCFPTVDRECPVNDDKCKINPVCVIADDAGCVYEDVVCPDPEPCMRYIRDPDVDGCCVSVPVECPVQDDSTLCFNFSECDVNLGTNGACPEPTPKMCVADNCKIIHPDFVASNGCDAESGECIFADLNCNIDGACEDRACNATSGECMIVSEERCSVCPIPCVNNACERTQCVQQLCDTANTTYTDCETPVADDECTLSVGCDPVGGCQYEPVDCTNFPHTACETVARDSSVAGCCTTVPVECPEDNPCTTYTCDDVEGCVAENLCTLDTDCQFSVCQNNECVVADRVPDRCPEPEDKCLLASCSDGACITEPVVCESDDLCVEPRCDSTDGTCLFSMKDCDDGNPCTIDSCSEGTCVNTPKDCNPDSNMCINAECDATTGDCIATAVECADEHECTLDSCDPAVGCVRVPDDARCASGDICIQSLGCDLELGCVYEDLSCPEDEDFCTTEYCKPFVGCTVSQLDCTVDDNNETKTDEDESECGILYFCDSERGECAQSDVSCAVPVATVVAASVLGTAAVVGIVVGIVVAVALFAGGAGVYSVYQNADGGASGSVVTNPLYEGSATGGENPLFEG